MSKEAKKPLTYCDISKIQPGKHCYSIKGKIVSCKTVEKTKQNGEKFNVIEGVIADASGCADFRFQADQAAAIKQGAVVSVRNGKSSVVNEHIVLEIDRFGKIAEENIQIDKPNTDENISSVSWEKTARNK